MPDSATVARYIERVLNGDHAAGIQDWYTEDATMQEKQGEPRRGRNSLVEQEQATLYRMERVETKLLAPPLIDGDTVVIRWRFTFYPKAGGRRQMEEVAWQTWRGNKIAAETFFYDPAQLKA